jgi:hypothetical protein
MSKDGEGLTGVPSSRSGHWFRDAATIVRGPLEINVELAERTLRMILQMPVVEAHRKTIRKD